MTNVIDVALPIVLSQSLPQQKLSYVLYSEYLHLQTANQQTMHDKHKTSLINGKIQQLLGVTEAAM